jgi:hypothetical protein
VRFFIAMLADRSMNPNPIWRLFKKNSEQLVAGDWVEVKSPKEIAETLDAEGTLEGLPFMPEMLETCGRRFRVLRPAEKTCIEIADGDYVIREFSNNDVVLLEGLRCSGKDHDGCQRLCMFFWKSAWLRKVEGDESLAVADKAGLTALRSRLKTMTAPGRYFCQSTELAKACCSRKLARSEILLKCLRDVRFGAVGVCQMALLILVPLYRKIRDRVFGRPRLLGKLTRTPVGNLRLEPGELVEVKSLEEIRETLDHHGRNRGLVCDIELGQFCGKKFRVRARLDRMISEATAEMRRVEGTVILDGTPCLCARALGGCPRLDHSYWREIWLKREEQSSSV